jgi:hypothetical protein
MKYTLDWIDATMTEHYESEQALIKSYKERGITVQESGGYITNNENWNDYEKEWGIGWYDFDAVHEFEAKNDQEAKKHVIEFIGRELYGDIGGGTGVFTLQGENGFSWTEEDMGDEYNNLVA